MMSPSSLDKSLGNYQKLLNDTQQIVDILTGAIDDLELAATNIESCYSVEEVSADAGQIINCRKNMQDNKNFLKNTIIPAIIQKIEQIQKETELIGTAE